MLTYERMLWKSGVDRIAGIDEAGRGPLAGPVVAAAVIFPKKVRIPGVADSKKLTAPERETLFVKIQEKAVSVGIGVVSHTIIDEINILQATMRAMAEAVGKLSPPPQHLLIDGNYYRNEGFSYNTIIGGDGTCFSIAAASIIAKVTRDRIMTEMDGRYPQYGFARHKGYCTREHIAAIKKFGPCEIHRKSFHVHSFHFEDARAGTSDGHETIDLFEQA